MTQQTDYKHLNLHRKIIEVMRNVERLTKDKDVSMGGAGNYKAITEFKVTSVLRNELINYGITIVPIDIEMERTDYVNESGPKPAFTRITSMRVKYRITNADNPDDFIIASSAGQGSDSGDKGAGKASTYAAKILLIRLFNIPTGGDEDRLSNESTREIANIEALKQERKLLYATHFKTPESFSVWVAEKFDIAFDFKDEENLPELIEEMRKIKKGDIK
ncbi:MAG: ERF family protein [Legionellales bacterium]|jgi:hypothetical protein